MKNNIPTEDELLFQSRLERRRFEDEEYRYELRYGNDAYAMKNLASIPVVIAVVNESEIGKKRNT